MAQPLAEARERTQATGAQVRLRAVRAQLSACSILSALAKFDIAHSRVDDAHKLKGRLGKVLEVVRRHLDESHHLPPESLTAVRDELAKVERLVREIEA